MKFYIASSFKNKQQVKFVSNKLKEKGFIHTYDWTKNDRATTKEQLIDLGVKEKTAVLESDFIVVLLPGGKGTHIELGMAIAQGIKVYLYSPNDDINHFETTSTFYHLPEVQQIIGTIEELVDQLQRETRSID
ncbi:group-specific protein [Salipaludibacillus keqinensis]|uniref:Group-specific protein n=1 Tax=Salipaludibacillus keqinensis TaxID=2045207 RepID=A0A323THG4_9BACI|nr:nucleoside 2-deoxyribosyltransferase [Salipaludibacillus keqinensis]PYZ93364.1 group-specific protein [Salipaludibacillus keqinensis]